MLVFINIQFKIKSYWVISKNKMTDVGAVLIQLKLDSMANVEAWQKELNVRKDEAIETLKAEGVFVESWFHVELEGRDYLIGPVIPAIAQADKILPWIAASSLVPKTSERKAGIVAKPPP